MTLQAIEASPFHIVAASDKFDGLEHAADVSTA